MLDQTCHWCLARELSLGIILVIYAVSCVFFFALNASTKKSYSRVIFSAMNASTKKLELASTANQFLTVLQKKTTKFDCFGSRVESGGRGCTKYGFFGTHIYNGEKKHEIQVFFVWRLQQTKITHVYSNNIFYSLVAYSPLRGHRRY